MLALCGAGANPDVTPALLVCSKEAIRQLRAGGGQSGWGQMSWQDGMPIPLPAAGPCGNGLSPCLRLRPGSSQMNKDWHISARLRGPSAFCRRCALTQFPPEQGDAPVRGGPDSACLASGPPHFFRCTGLPHEPQGLSMAKRCQKCGMLLDLRRATEYRG